MPTRPELLAEAKSRGLKGYSTLKKADLQKLLDTPPPKPPRGVPRGTKAKAGGGAKPAPKAKEMKEKKLKLPPTFKSFYNDEQKYEIDSNKFGETTLTAMLDSDLGGEDGDKELKKAHKIANARYKIFKTKPEAINAKSYQQLASRFRDFV